LSHKPLTSIKFCPYCGTTTYLKNIHNENHVACPECGWVHYEDPKVATAVLIRQNGSILLTRRVFNPHKGEWTLPAGFMNAHEDPEAAAIRECHEETGLTVNITGIFDIIGGREHERGADMIVIYTADIIAGELAAGDDADKVGFFSINNLPPLAFKATQKVVDRIIKASPENS
jgi:ADP-ribose pyrophosphatase YjhB (NUDIX family)